MNTEKVHALLRERKSVYPKQYIEKEISKEIIQEILESANWAPTHKMTEPWRFKVFHGASQKRIGDFLSSKYRANCKGDDFSVVRFEKMKNNPVRSGAVVAICMQRDPDERVPEWEEIASVACAVQNMWLAASSYGIGAYWSSPSYLRDFGEVVHLAEGEKCIGLFYMGYYEPFKTNRKRSAIEEKVSWIQ